MSDGEDTRTAASELPAQRESDDPRPSPEQIAADLARIRHRLADTVDTLVERAHPTELAGRAAGSLKGIFVDPKTGLRTDRVVKMGVAVVGTVGTLLLLRRIFRR